MEESLILLQLLDEHKLTSRHKLKDSPGRTGDSWRIRTTGVIANAFLASPPRPLRKASGSAGRILARTLFFRPTKEKSLTSLQLLDEHKLTSRQKLKDSPGRTGDSWRIRVTGVIANAFLASPPRPLRKASGSAGRILARTLLFCTAKEKSLTSLQLLDEHQRTYEHNLKDSPGRTGDSWRIRTIGVIAKELLASPPRPLRKASGSAGRILARTLFFRPTKEKSLTSLQLLDEHKLTSRQKLKDSPGRTGDSWRIRVTGVIANAFLASPPRPLRKASGSAGRILARTLLFCTAKEKSLTSLQLLDEHQRTYEHNLKDSPGRTGDSWRIRTIGVIAKELLASPPRPLRKASGSAGRILARTLFFRPTKEKSLNNRIFTQ
ncbi:hypothetical protein DV702_03705 [Sporosarcina sp. PTS2304]|nr:hypothetical protein DV702_03705 [Sporosarcina sp. PTS2304]